MEYAEREFEISVDDGRGVVVTRGVTQKLSRRVAAEEIAVAAAWFAGLEPFRPDLTIGALEEVFGPIKRETESEQGRRHAVSVLLRMAEAALRCDRAGLVRAAGFLFDLEEVAAPTPTA